MCANEGVYRSTNRREGKRKPSQPHEQGSARKKIMRQPPRAPSSPHFRTPDPSRSSSTARLVITYETGAQLYQQDRRGLRGARVGRRSHFHVDLAPRSLRTFRSTLRPSSIPVTIAIRCIRVDSKRESLRACELADRRPLCSASGQVGIRGVSVRQRAKKKAKI